MVIKPLLKVCVTALIFGYLFIPILLAAYVCTNQETSSTEESPLVPKVLMTEESGSSTVAKFIVVDVDYVFKPFPRSILVPIGYVAGFTVHRLDCDRGNPTWDTLEMPKLEDLKETTNFLLYLCVPPLVFAFFITFIIRYLLIVINRPSVKNIYDLYIFVFFLLIVIHFYLFPSLYPNLWPKIQVSPVCQTREWDSGENVAVLWIDNSLDHQVRCEDASNSEHVVYIPAHSVEKLTVSAGNIKLKISDSTQVLEEQLLAICPEEYKGVFVYSVCIPDRFFIESRTYR